MNMKEVLSNNEINKILKPLTNGLNIGANKATCSNIASKIYFSNTWEFGVNLSKIVGAFF